VTAHNREFAQGDLGGRKTGYLQLTKKSWPPGWVGPPGGGVNSGIGDLDYLIAECNTNYAHIYANLSGKNGE